MSRIGKKPVLVPPGVEVQVIGNTVAVKGPKGQLQREFNSDVAVEYENNQLVVKKVSDNILSRALYGLTRTLLENMVKGVTQGFEKNLELVGVGYKASKQGNKLILNMGYSHPVEIDPPEGIELNVPAPTKVVVSGIDKEKVGAMAANIRMVRPPEPYKGKGIKYLDEHIRRKAGKTGAKK